MLPTNAEKRQVWEAYRAGKPVRVPVTFGVNARVVLLDPQWNPQGFSFEDYWNDARVLAQVQMKFLEYQVEHLNQHCDSPTEWPERFDLSVDVQNVYDSAYFGGQLEFRDGQVPDVSRPLMGPHRERIFSTDIAHPMDNPFVRQSLRRHEELVRLAPGLSFRNVVLGVKPVVWGFDGPLTVAANLRGGDLFVDFYEDPGYVARLLDFITRGVIIRNRAMARHFERKAFAGPGGSIADDSIELISTDMYRRAVMPFHRDYLSQWSAEGPHSIHLCGDTTRHFPAIRDELHVRSFDTGFPVDHGRLREALGPDVEILGGPEVTLLREGTAEAVYERTRAILKSGVMEGGRFVLREANNLPPCCPEPNLAAMYRACLDHGRYR
jgi:uroporphyrinogen-III decarboxylase